MNFWTAPFKKGGGTGAYPRACGAIDFMRCERNYSRGSDICFSNS